jgi:hypothetical protein
MTKRAPQIVDGSNNFFSLAYYESIIMQALDADYKFVTLREYYDAGCPDEKHFIMRHDLDKLPSSLPPMLKVEEDHNVRSSIFVRVHGDYNPFHPRTVLMLQRAQAKGHELGLHSDFMEFGRIIQKIPHKERWETFDTYDKTERVFLNELDALRSHFHEINSVACHRDINYTHNSLPWLQDWWTTLKEENDLHYEAYDGKILESSTYVNEGLSPHICWRNKKPEDVIKTGRSIYLLTHSHWWFEEHPHEHW